MSPAHPAPRAGPPPLTPFGLVLRHDGSWLHDGEPILNRKLRARFDRSVRYLPDVDKYVVQIGHFRGEIGLEEAGFFVRSVDTGSGEIQLSDGTAERLDVSSLRASEIDGAWICTVKRDLREGGLPARFLHSTQAELLAAVEEAEEGFAVRVHGRLETLPAL